MYRFRLTNYSWKLSHSLAQARSKSLAPKRDCGLQVWDLSAEHPCHQVQRGLILGSHFFVYFSAPMDSQGFIIPRSCPPMFQNSNPPRCCGDGPPSDRGPSFTEHVEDGLVRTRVLGVGLMKVRVLDGLGVNLRLEIQGPPKVCILLHHPTSTE